MKRSNEKGVTLIELMVVVIIISILLVVVLPSYQAALQKGRRADAMAGLQEIANRQEKFLLDRSTYTTSLADLDIDSVSDDEHYDLSIDTPTVACPIASCFSLTATPATGSPQEHDTRCTSFTLGSNGLKSATGSTAALCW